MSPVLAALTKQDFDFLDTTLTAAQRDFEAGRSSEIELRNAFRPFYRLDAQQEAALRLWSVRFPRSYVAHLALGIFLKKAGWAARGDKFISETSVDKITEMRRQFELSQAELKLSEGLTKKPYLTVFHLLDIARAEGDDDASRALLDQANRMLPNNHLVRNRYLTSLTPRWGGSYEQMSDFIRQAAKDGADQVGIMQMDAILHNDRGDMAWRNGDHESARANFVAALNLASKVGGSFRDDFLSSAYRYLCSESKGQSYCQ